jgi:2-dehydropantoate 2-reductase
MRIAIVGAGGVGGSFGGFLAKSGENVALLARGDHLAAIRADGLRVDGRRGDFVVRPDASDDAAKLGVADIVVFAVKLYQIEEAARAAAPLFGPDTLGISLLNGIDGAETATRILKGRVVLGGCAYFGGKIVAPGHVRYTSSMASIVFGAPEGETARAKANDFAERSRGAGFGAEVTDDVRGALWDKLVGMAANSALTASARLPVGYLYQDADVLDVVVALFNEAVAVARAQGVILPDNTTQTWVARFQSFPPDVYASMYHDIARGGPLEVDGLSGYLVREGRRLGVPTPHHAALYAVLKPHRTGIAKPG